MRRDEWHLAQINIGRLVAPESDPRVEGFFEALDRTSALAFKQPHPRPGQSGPAIDHNPNLWCMGRA